MRDKGQKKRTIITSQGYTNEFPTAIRFLADGRVNTEPLITAKINLNNIVSQGFKVLTTEDRYKHVKILVSPE